MMRLFLLVIRSNWMVDLEVACITGGLLSVDAEC
jgi:hypothetical protein